MKPPVSTVNVIVLLVVSQVQGKSYSQRHDASTPPGSWHPSGPPPSRSQFQSRSGRPYLPYPDSLLPQDIYQNGAPPRQPQTSINEGGGPESRTVTASITWPRERRAQESDPQPYPRDDYNDPPEAVPDSDPPSLGRLSSRQSDQVIRTTLLTPLSHGYVVALAKKSLLPRGNGGGAAGSLLNIKPRLQDAFREEDQPAFLVYVPPNRNRLDGRRRLSSAARPSQLISPANVPSRPVPLQRPQSPQDQPVRFLVPIVAGDDRSPGQFQLAQQPLQLVAGGHPGQGVVMYLPQQLQQNRVQEGPAPFMILPASLGHQATPVQYLTTQNAMYPSSLDVSAEGLMLNPAFRAQHNEMFRLL
ncbi:unnamed protein product, partial [Ixodes hexagonus]